MPTGFSAAILPGGKRCIRDLFKLKHVSTQGRSATRLPPPMTAGGLAAAPWGASAALVYRGAPMRLPLQLPGAVAVVALPVRKFRRRSRTNTITNTSNGIRERARARTRQLACQHPRARARSEPGASLRGDMSMRACRK